MMHKYKLSILVGVLIVIIFGAIALNQFFILRKAHATFENYYAFRGGVQLIEKTDTYGICKLPSGQTIKLVKISNRWYLDRDGPGIF